MRRYFVDAVPKGKEFDYSNATVQGIQFCTKLFDYERIAAERKMDRTIERHTVCRKKNQYSMHSGNGWNNNVPTVEPASRKR